MDRNASGSPQEPIDVLGYVRVSSDQQAESGLGIEAQKETIRNHAKLRGWNVVEWIEDKGESGRSLDRPGIQRALDLLEDGGPDVLVVAKLDRLSRSTVDFGKVLERAQKGNWSVIALDHGLDMTTANGEMVASILVSIAQWESRKIGERTSEALQAKKRRGERIGGNRVPAHTRKRIVTMRENGATLQTIADELNRDEVPTARSSTKFTDKDGKKKDSKWWPSTVRSVLDSVGYEE